MANYNTVKIIYFVHYIHYIPFYSIKKQFLLRHFTKHDGCASSHGGGGCQLGHHRRRWRRQDERRRGATTTVDDWWLDELCNAKSSSMSASQQLLASKLAVARWCITSYAMDGGGKAAMAKITTPWLGYGRGRRGVTARCMLAGSESRGRPRRGGGAGGAREDHRRCLASRARRVGRRLALEIFTGVVHPSPKVLL